MFLTKEASLSCWISPPGIIQFLLTETIVSIQSRRGSRILTFRGQVGHRSRRPGESNILSTVRIGGAPSTDSLGVTRGTLRWTAGGLVGGSRLIGRHHSTGIQPHIGCHHARVIAVKHSRSHGRKTRMHWHVQAHSHGSNPGHRSKFRDCSGVVRKARAVVNWSTKRRRIHEHGDVGGEFQSSFKKDVSTETWQRSNANPMAHPSATAKAGRSYIAPVYPALPERWRSPSG